MINEEVKQEIELLVKKETEGLREALEFIALPLKTQYKVLTWYGNADGVNNLTPAFDLNVILNKKIIIKSIECIPYYVNDSEDVEFSDGTTETIPAGARVNRVFDMYSNLALGAHLFRMIINGSIVPFSLNDERGVPPPDFKFDNIYYRYPEKIQNIDILYGTEILEDLTTPGTPIHPNVKIFIECYLQ